MEIDTNTSTHANSVPVKLSYEGQMRRFPFTGGDSFNTFYDQVLDILGLEKGANVFIKYTDPENDLITITSDVELRSAIVPGELLRVVVVPQAARGVDIPPVLAHAPASTPTVVTAPIVHIPFVAPPAGVQPEGVQQFYQPYHQQPPFPFGGAFPPGFGREFGPGRWAKKMGGELEKKDKKEKKEKKDSKEKDEEKREKQEKKHEKKMHKMMKKMHYNNGHPYSHPHHAHTFPPHFGRPPFAVGFGVPPHHAPHHVHAHPAHHPHAHPHPHHFGHHPHARFMGAPHPNDKKDKLIARFVADVNVEDGTVVLPNHNFVKTWRLRNAGAVAWPVDCGLLFIGKRSDDLGAPAFVPVQQQVVVPADAAAGVVAMTDSAAPATPAVAAAAAVEPGQEIDISVPLIAPAHTGRYTAYFRMCTKEGRKFGQRVWVSVVVPPVATAGAAAAAETSLVTVSGGRVVTGSSSSEGEREADRCEALVDVVLQNELFRTFGVKRHWVFRLLQKNNGDVDKVTTILTKKMQKKQQQQQY